MTVPITGSVKDVTGVEDNDTPWLFASVIRFADDGSVITEKPREVRAVSGNLKVNLVPGYAIVTYGKQVWQVTVPETATTLKALIEAGVAFPPDTAQALLDAAVGQYVETHREQFRTRAVPVEGDPTMVQWFDEAGNPVGDPVPQGTVISEEVAQAAAEAAAPAAVTADVESRAPQVIADPDNPSTHIRIKLGDATGPPSPASATWLSVDGEQVAAFDLDTTPPTPSDLGAYSSAEVDTLIAAAVASLVTNGVFTNPRIEYIYGANTHTVVRFTDMSDGVNYLRIYNTAAGANLLYQAVGSGNTGHEFLTLGTGQIVIRVPAGQTPTIVGTGADTNHNTNITSKGTGVVQANGVKVAQILSGTAALDFGSVSAQSFADLTVTVTGAAAGDCVSLGVPTASVTAGIAYTAWVSATNTVTVRAHNYTGGALDPASGTFKASILK